MMCHLDFSGWNNLRPQQTEGLSFLLAEQYLQLLIATLKWLKWLAALFKDIQRNLVGNKNCCSVKTFSLQIHPTWKSRGCQQHHLQLVPAITFTKSQFEFTTWLHLLFFISKKALQRPMRQEWGQLWCRFCHERAFMFDKWKPKEGNVWKREK